MENENNSIKLDNKRSIEKQILVVFSKTLGVIITLIFASILYLSLLAPQVMATFTSKIGMKEASFYYSKVKYSRSNNINDLYLVVNKGIELKKDKEIVKYCNYLFNYEKYYDFISYVENKNISEVAGQKNEQNKVILMISLSNEDLYLKNKYVNSLINLNEVSKAYEFCKNDINATDEDISLQSRIHWAFGVLFKLENVSFLEENGKDLIEKNIKMLYKLYKNTDYGALNTEDKFCFLVLENTLKGILKDTMLLKDKAVVFSGLTYNEIENMINELNGVAV